MTPYRMIPVQAQNITSIGYEPEKKFLYVEFRTGLSYRYDNVPRRLYLGMLSADSADDYLRDYIRSKYPATSLPYSL